jgi:hypothetical protein
VLFLWVLGGSLPPGVLLRGDVLESGNGYKRSHSRGFLEKCNGLLSGDMDRRAPPLWGMR